MILYTLGSYGAEKSEKVHYPLFEHDNHRKNTLPRNLGNGNKVESKIGGHFFYPNSITESFNGHDVLLIAGGVGINPLASIFFHINDLKCKNSFKFFETISILISKYFNTLFPRTI